MLQEDQTAELLLWCEQELGVELRQIRGNLTKALTRASAVWELLVIEEASRLGKVQYEPDAEGSPDLFIEFPNGRPVWIEIKYLARRYVKEEQQTQEVANWIFNEAKRLGVPPESVKPRFGRFVSDKGKSIRILPQINMRKFFLNDPELRYFFRRIKMFPHHNFSCDLTDYTISIDYWPKFPSSGYTSWSELPLEQPAIAKENAIYRALREKGKQHKVEAPHVICIGSDQSPALNRKIYQGNLAIERAIEYAFKDYSSISAAIIVFIESNIDIFGQEEERKAELKIFENPSATHPLEASQLHLLTTMNFNRRKYTSTLPNNETNDLERFLRVSGCLTWRSTEMSEFVEIPSNTLMRILSGKTNLYDSFRIRPGDFRRIPFENGWAIRSVSMKEGNIEKGEDSKVVLELVSPIFNPYRPHKKSKG